jgi:hypothetical protein
MEVMLYRRYRRGGGKATFVAWEFSEDVEGFNHLIAGLIPDARVRIYPDTAHGFLFDHPSEAAVEINASLTASHETASSSPWK